GRDRTEGFQTWDLADADRHASRTGHGAFVDAVAFSPDGSRLATGSRDGTIRIWPIDSVGSADVLHPRVAPTRLAFRPDGKVLAGAGSRSVFVFDPGRGELLGELKGHGGNVKGLAYSPDGRHLASAGLDGVVILRDAQTNEVVGQRHLEIGKLTSLIWRADSSGLIAGGEKFIAVCELAELLVKEPRRKRGGDPLSLAGHRFPVQGLSYSPDGRRLVSWSRLQWRLWDLS